MVGFPIPKRRICLQKALPAARIVKMLLNYKTFICNILSTLFINLADWYESG